jgi:hypothetical protein
LRSNRRNSDDQQLKIDMAIQTRIAQNEAIKAAIALISAVAGWLRQERQGDNHCPAGRTRHRHGPLPRPRS